MLYVVDDLNRYPKNVLGQFDRVLGSLGVPVPERHDVVRVLDYVHVPQVTGLLAVPGPVGFKDEGWDLVLLREPLSQPVRAPGSTGYDYINVPKVSKGVLHLGLHELEVGEVSGTYDS